MLQGIHVSWHGGLLRSRRVDTPAWVSVWGYTHMVASLVAVMLRSQITDDMHIRQLQLHADHAQQCHPLARSASQQQQQQG